MLAQNVQIVISLLKKHNISILVLSPGGTNSSFVKYVQNDNFFTCYSIVDERSAIYFAIGLYLSTGKVIATCCTSAQATRNYLPGLTEAFYKHVPILAITFSKHPQYTYQDYMQAPDQTSLPKDSVKKSFALPYISNKHDRFHCERMVNDAIIEISRGKYGPVQLNIPMLDYELAYNNDCVHLPDVKVIRRYTAEVEWNLNISTQKIMIVIGENRPFALKDIDCINRFVSSHNAFVYVNHLSNYRGAFTIFGNLLLSCISQSQFDEMLSPDILITIGGQTGDYALYHKIADSKNIIEHWRISEDGLVVDTYDKLTKVFECSISYFFDKITCEESIHTYYEKWKEEYDKINLDIELPFSNAYLAQQLHKDIPPRSIVNFAILNSLRVWSFFELDTSIQCYSNVGAFGIDGGLSTLIGQSVMVDNLCFMIIGDLAFFYDMNSLGIKYIKNNLRILLVNNNGGVEFKLAGNPNENLMLDKFVAAAGHFKNAKGWAETNGFMYLSASGKDEFENFKNIFLSKSNVPIVFEIFTNDIDEAQSIDKIISTNQILSFTEKLKRIVVKKIGEKNADALKKVKQIFNANR